jgi:hypothetical protein
MPFAFRRPRRPAPIVNFVIGGVQKGGTTALDAYLRAHPQICMADCKATHFFDGEQRFAAGPVDYRPLHAQFQPSPAQRTLGEATAIYTYWLTAPRRIWDYNPAMKWIVLLRNPIERAYSHWNMEHGRSTDTVPLLEALNNEGARCREALPLQHRVYSYIDRGHYLEQLHRLWTFFPREQTLILKNEELRLKPEAALARVCDFLQVDRLPQVRPNEVHSRPYAEPLPGAAWEFLHGVFEFEIRALERLLNWDCSAWLAPPASRA